jgi:hypothetical protein
MDPNSETTASATGPNQNGKRTRFSSPATASVVERPMSALESARFVTSVATASLQPAIKSLSEHHSSKFLQHKTALVNLDTTKSRFQSDDFIPTSARFKFQLTASDSVKENLTQEFDTLAERANLSLLVFKRNIKDYIEKTVDLEIQVNHNALVNTFCTAVGSIGIAYAMNTPALTSRIARVLILHTIESHYEVLLKHSGLDINCFFPTFKSATEDPHEVHVFGTLLEADIAVVQPFVDSFKSLLEALLVRNWDEYLKVKENHRLQLEIKKFADLEMTEAATADVAMDLEDPAKREELIRDLISEQVSKSNKKLQQEVHRLSATLQKEVSKNGARGAQKSSASSKNQPDKATKATQRQSRKPKAAQQAAGPANASAKNNRSNGSAQKSSKNNGNSRTNTRSRQRK